MSCSSGPEIVNDGLVTHLDAASINSYSGIGNIWVDLTGNGHNATLVNSPTFNGEYISFNGIDQYATHNASNFVSGGGTMFTFEVWFKMRTLPTGTYCTNEHIWGGQNGNNIVLIVTSYDNRLNLVYDDSRYNDGTGHWTTPVDLSQWNQWVMVGDGTTNTIEHYINREFNRSGAVYPGQEVRGWSGSSYIAYDTRWLTYSELDVAVLKQYNRKLTTEEVKQNFNALKDRYGI